MKLGTTLAAAGVAAGGLLLGVGTSGMAAAQSGARTYSATLTPVPLNGQTSASGHLTLTLNGDVATISEQVSGLASTFMGKPFPHVQHIHGGADGTCPTAAADTNHDGVISTVEGKASYGGILTTLSESPGGTSPSDGTNTSIAPSGSSFTYHRTITLSSASLSSLEKGNAVIVVHGLDPATAPKAATTEKSPLVPSLPLAATAPALCGPLVASQMSAVPSGAPQTGGGSTAGTQDLGLIAGGGVSLALGAGLLTGRRLRTRRAD